MLLTAIEILMLVGAIILPLVPRKVKSKTTAKANEPAHVELSNYVVTENGDLEELSKPHDTSLSQ